jgi:hypothetical protein
MRGGCESLLTVGHDQHCIITPIKDTRALTLRQSAESEPRQASERSRRYQLFTWLAANPLRATDYGVHGP